MNKEEFLKRLASLLAVLQEDEVRDIVDEYEQHIDMKMAEGLSVEEAIDDFGSVEELAGEILSAYHVKPNAKPEEAGTGKPEYVKVHRESRLAKAFQGAGSRIKAVCGAGKEFFGKIVRNCKEIIVSPFAAIGRRRKRRGRAEEGPGVAAENAGRKTAGAVTEAGKGVCMALKRCMEAVVRCFFWCIFVIFGCMEIVFLLGLGMMIVLMPLGYPVVGMMVMIIGAALSVGTVTCYAALQARRKNR